VRQLVVVLGDQLDPGSRAVMEVLERQSPGNPGRLAAFDRPVTRTEALEALADLLARRLPDFGHRQDAMGRPSRLSAARVGGGLRAAGARLAGARLAGVRPRDPLAGDTRLSRSQRARRESGGAQPAVGTASDRRPQATWRATP